MLGSSRNISKRQARNCLISLGRPGGISQMALFGGAEGEIVVVVLSLVNQVLKLVKVSSMRAGESVVFLLLGVSFLVCISQLEAQINQVLSIGRVLRLLWMIL